MSDNLRKGLGEQASEKLTPDSQKSTTDKIGENVSGAADKVAGSVQPEGQKSTTQKLGDATRGGSDNAQNQGEGVLKQAQDGLSNAAASVQNAIGGGKQ
ncbi:hypothetical protein G6514_008914 [Epicoccum nigrum]|nr:hypothetical protein G6514_008914 [Epicoccum nigrum]